jgi:hypothetical protein
LPFYDNRADEELDHLVFYLNGLRDSLVDDVRVPNEEAFGLAKLIPNGSNRADLNSESARGKNCSEHTSEDNSHHKISKEYLRCDPVEIPDDKESKAYQFECRGGGRPC